jgi:hypothetical protein
VRGGGVEVNDGINAGTVQDLFGTTKRFQKHRYKLFSIYSLLVFVELIRLFDGVTIDC